MAGSGGSAENGVKCRKWRTGRAARMCHPERSEGAGTWSELRSLRSLRSLRVTSAYPLALDTPTTRRTPVRPARLVRPALLELVPPQLVEQRPEAHTQEPGRVAAVAAGGVERPPDAQPLQLLHLW